MSGSPGGLPVPTTRLVGRDREAAEVRRLLGTSRLVTLAGAGGTGKTRLALHVAGDRSDARWVDLAALADPDLVPARVAGALGVPDSPRRPVLPAMVEHLTAHPGLPVGNHLSSVYRKLGVGSRTAAIRETAELGRSG